MDHHKALWDEAMKDLGFACKFGKTVRCYSSEERRQILHWTYASISFSQQITIFIFYIAFIRIWAINFKSLESYVSVGYDIQDQSGGCKKKCTN